MKGPKEKKELARDVSHMHWKVPLKVGFLESGNPGFETAQIVMPFRQWMIRIKSGN